MGIFGRSNQVVTTPPVTIVAFGKKKPAPRKAKPARRPPAKKPATKKQLTRNGYLCFYKMVDNRGGGKTKFYFWAKKAKTGEGWRKVYEVPEDRVIKITRTGMPVLAKIGKKPGKALRPQCVAVSAAGVQCKNSARQGSSYCGSHKGYQPKGAKAIAAAAPKRKVASSKARTTRGKATQATDTTPKVRKASDTVVKVRKTSTAKPRPQQITRNGYKLYQKGPRFFFSKSAAKQGWKRVTKLPPNRKIKVTPNGLPVLASK